MLDVPKPIRDKTFDKFYKRLNKTCKVYIKNSKDEQELEQIKWLDSHFFAYPIADDKMDYNTYLLYVLLWRKSKFVFTIYGSYLKAILDIIQENYEVNLTKGQLVKLLDKDISSYSSIINKKKREKYFEENKDSIPGVTLEDCGC